MRISDWSSDVCSSDLCRFDQLDANTPLMQIMAATVNYLSKHVHRHDTERIFTELRHSLADITPMSAQRLPWSEVRIDRSNRRWESLCALAKDRKSTRLNSSH